MKSKSIELVVHCFCPPGLDTYAEHLKWMWSSLVRYPTEAHVTLSVCFTPQDSATTKRLAAMMQNWDSRRPRINTVPLPPGSLFRRAIGRHLCSQRSMADVLWFTDVDYMFGSDCLNDVCNQVGPDDGLCMPSHIWIHCDHETGNTAVESQRQVDYPKINFSEFVERRQKIAIGGVQIIGGNTARKIGYLGGTKWTEPVDASSGFRSCRCDKAWRHHNKLSAARLEIRNCLRIRHISDGRDFDLQGKNIGKEVW